MKRLNLMFLVIGATFLFFSCSKDNSSLTPDLNQSDQETTSLKAEKIPFIGTSTPTGVVLDPGTTTELPNGNILMMGQISVWCESADLDLVSGRSIWEVNSLTFLDGSVKFWGKADIFVGEDCEDPDGNEGKWRLSFHGDGNFGEGIIVVDANGTGKEGTVKGMVGKWTYTFDFVGFFYNSEGYIK